MNVTRYNRLLNVDQAGKRLGISRASLYKLISRREIRSVVVGRRRRMISERALNEYIDQLEEEAAS